MDVLNYWLHLIYILMVLLASFGLVSRLRTWPLEDRITVAFILFTLLPLLCGGLIHKFGFDPLLFHLALAGLSVWGALQLQQLGVSDAKPLAGFAALFILHLIFKQTMQLFWEFPAQGGDWFIHTVMYPAQFLRGDWTPPLERPGFFNLIITSWLVLLQKSPVQYWLSQTVTLTCNSLLLWPTFLIARRYLKGREIWLVLLFLALNPFMVYQSVYTWPKNLMSFFVLTQYYYLFIRERSPFTWLLAGVCAGLGYLAHPTGAFFSAGFALVLLLRRQWQGLLLYVGPAALLLIPQLAWSFAYTGKLSSSKLIYYPFALDSYLDVYKYSFPELLQRFWAKFPGEVLHIRLMHILRTLTPFFRNTDPSQYFRFFDSWPAAMTLPVFLLGLFGLLRVRRVEILQPQRLPLLIFFLVPFLITVFQWGYTHPGLFGQSLHPWVPVTALFAFGVVAGIPDVRAQKTVWALIMTWTIIQLCGNWLDIHAFYLRFERVNLWKSLGMTHHVIPGFTIQQLKSAYFLINTPMEKAVQIILALLTCGGLTYLSKLWLKSSQPESALAQSKI